MVAPANDNFANALTVSLTNGEYTSAAWDPTNATIETDETGLNGVPHHTVWFKFTPALGGTYTFDTGLSQGVEPDTTLHIYTGTALANLVRIASDNDGGPAGNANYTSLISDLALTAGTTYYIQVASLNSTQWLGPYVLHVKAGVLDAPPATPAAPPILTLTGTSGTVTDIDMSTGAETFNYTPTFGGSFAMQVTSPAGWMPSFEVYDDDSDPANPLYVDNDGTLGAVWGEDVPLRIVMKAGATEPNPTATVTVTWSYAARASSRLDVYLETDVLNETPASLYATISGGYGGDTVTISLIGPTTADDMQTEVLNTYGYIEDLAIPLPGLETGDYFLRVEGVASGSEDVPFTITGDPLSFLGSSPKSLPVAPTRTAQVRWRLYELHGNAVAYEFPHNPRSWSNLLPPNNFTHENTTAPDGQILTWQAGDQPWRMEFTGYLDTKAEYEALTFWYGLHRRFWLVDHRNRAWLVTFEQFDAAAKIVPNRPWAHDYTMKTIIFMQG